MVIVNGKTFRNLQEQVYYLTNIIEDATDIVKNVVGAVTSPSALPAYTSVNYGTTYAVGAASPYNYYVSTASGWVNLGTFPKAGPSGADGKDGNSIYLTSANLTPNTDYIYTQDIYNPSNIPYKAGDLILSTNASGAYLYTVSNVRSPDVLDIVYRATLSGMQGPKGDTGPQGPKGDKGDPGTYADVVSIDFPFGQETVGYNTTDGITLVGQIRLTDTNGDTNDVAADIALPIFPGDGISIDATADGTGVEVKNTNPVTLDYSITTGAVTGIDGDVLQAKYDANGNDIVATYATQTFVNNKAEAWTFTLDDGSTVVKNVLVN